MKRVTGVLLLIGLFGSAGFTGLKQRERLAALAAERECLGADAAKRSAAGIRGNRDDGEKKRRIAVAAVELESLARRARQMMEDGEDGRIAGLLAGARTTFQGIGFEDAREILGEGDEMSLGCLLQVLDAGEAMKLMVSLGDRAGEGGLVHPFRRWIQSDPREAVKWHEEQLAAGGDGFPDSIHLKMEEEALMGQARIDPAGAMQRLRGLAGVKSRSELRNLGVKLGMSLTRNGERADLLEYLAGSEDEGLGLAREGVIGGMIRELRGESFDDAVQLAELHFDDREQAALAGEVAAGMPDEPGKWALWMAEREQVAALERLVAGWSEREPDKLRQWLDGLAPDESGIRIRAAFDAAVRISDPPRR